MNDEPKNDSQKNDAQSSSALHLDQLTDNELLGLFVDRQSEAAFNELVARHSQMVLTVSRSIVSNQACVDDAFQATFLALVRNARRLRNSMSFAGWLCRVAKHAAIKALKTQQSREFQMDCVEPSIEIDPLTRLAAREVVQTLATELESIPRRYRESLTLFYFECLSRGEIAARMDCTEAVIKGLLQRGKQMLRTRLMKKGIVASMVVLGVQAIDQAAEASDSAVLISKTTATCVGHVTGVEAFPSKIINLSKAGEVSMSAFGSVVAKSGLATCALMMAALVPFALSYDLPKVQGRNQIVVELPSAEASFGNSVNVVVSLDQAQEQVDSRLEDDDNELVASNLEDSDVPLEIELVQAHWVPPVEELSHRIDTRTDHITSTGDDSTEN